uniref:Uncharacterized protein n=1 Tax=Anguilla anguilla TaxID=7936 RepID=A0A0E9QUF0_ANGAN
MLPVPVWPKFEKKNEKQNTKLAAQIYILCFNYCFKTIRLSHIVTQSLLVLQFPFHLLLYQLKCCCAVLRSVYSFTIP